MSDLDYSIHYRRFHDETAGHAQEMASWQEHFLSPYVPADRSARILDVGCGWGFTLRALRNLGFTNLTGLENSAEQAEQARMAGFSVEVPEDSARWLNSRPGTFDFVVLFDVLEHQPSAMQIELVRAIRRCLKPGGRLILTVPNANAILASRWRYIDFTHYTSFTEHSLTFVLANAGFAQIKIDNNKGLGRFPRRVWRRRNWAPMRKWLVRWLWLQVFVAELPWERIDDISFDLNLTAIAQ